MAPKHHPTPLSGGDRTALNKARAMTNILAAQSVEMRTKAEAMLQQADRLLCESWNERMWADGEPIDPSPTIDQGKDPIGKCRASNSHQLPRARRFAALLRGQHGCVGRRSSFGIQLSPIERTSCQMKLRGLDPLRQGIKLGPSKRNEQIGCSLRMNAKPFTSY
jgi:hypothetical protein